jgi:hypothetical protein
MSTFDATTFLHLAFLADFFMIGILKSEALKAAEVQFVNGKIFPETNFYDSDQLTAAVEALNICYAIAPQQLILRKHVLALYLSYHLHFMLSPRWNEFKTTIYGPLKGEFPEIGIKIRKICNFYNARV